jgi:hypothetical protein
MHTILLAVLLSTVPSLAGPQPSSIQVTINNPPNNPAGNPIAIRVSVASTFQLSQVVATIEGVNYPLAADPQTCSTCWTGSAAVTLTRGTHTITVTATDVFANQGSASSQFLFDQPPVLNVIAPADLAVARPGLRVTAFCADDDSGCQIRVQVVGCCTPIVLTQAPGPLDSVVSLSQFDGQQITLEISAIDSIGQQTSTSKTIYVDSSTRYQQRAVANGQIIAFDETRLLVTGIDSGRAILTVQSRVDGTETRIFESPILGGPALASGFLTPFGAIFVWGSQVLEWRSGGAFGTMFARGMTNSAMSLRVSGAYAIWTTGVGPTALMFEDIAAGSVVTVASDVLDINNSVAATGDVAYAANQGGVSRIFDYLNGMSTPLPHNGDPATSDVDPVTDGTSIVYGRITDAVHPAQIVSVTGGQETVRGVLTTPDVTPGRDYLAAGGWIAYRIPTSSGLNQIFAGPASGQPSQISFFSTSSAIAALDDSGAGNVAFVNGVQTYLAGATTPAAAIGSALGTSSFLHGNCYRVIGYTLFEVTAASIPPPSVSVTPASLALGVLRAADGSVAGVTAPRLVTITQTGAGPFEWGAATDVAWLRVTPKAGSGPGFAVVVDPAAPSLPPTGSALGHITITPTTPAAAVVIPVTITIYQNATTSPPFGAFDTPVNGAMGVAGSIAVTGWALDDVEVIRVTICRDAVAGEGVPGSEPNCAGNMKVYIGDGVFIGGARPDIQAAFPNVPLNGRAGWGYLMLTNFLPNQGNGTFTLYAYAFDLEGYATPLGSKTITVDNAHSTAPFGAIDTPGQGQVVGGLVPNFGWVLSPAPRFSDPSDGGTVTVFVDGAPVGSPGGWASRSDLSALFPGVQYPGVDAALGVFGLDTTMLANGIHTIAWSVTDNLGLTSGIGSRFFTVSNGGSVRAADMGTAGSHGATILFGRRGFDLSARLDYYFPDRNGVVTIEARELDRIELQLEPGATGKLITSDEPQPLPAGAQLDRRTGIFTWAPGPGFVGSYDFVLGGRRVRIVLRPGTDSHNVPRR